MADVVLEVGNPGQEESACIDVLEQGFCTDVGKVIEEELAEVQEGYRSDMVKYGKQLERYNNEKFNK